ncbi:unnamed protein product [Cuscuta epithymum]|uniref:Transmembrane protein n=1 Tax=Cuscuta epithymum TaxID=186058 RepID=A0AAV0DLM0_9ASTE|nr:unnamed protein product [Cuscuta epithymum]CAH9140707.1 unnamed protein product [Cuscuta epithymum]
MDDTHMDNQPSLGSNKVLILVGVCFLFVFVGTFASHNNHNSTKVETESTMTRPLVPMSNEMIWKAMSRHYYFHHHHTHNFINYVSKRVVPSQPNDRHNWVLRLPPFLVRIEGWRTASSGTEAGNRHCT